MASGSGKDQDDLQTQEPVHGEGDESAAAAAAAAAVDAAEEAAAPPSPVPPSERLQESPVHGPPGGGGGGGGQSPSAAVPGEAATVPDESKSKEFVPTSATSSSRSKTPLPPRPIKPRSVPLLRGALPESERLAVIEMSSRVREKWRAQRRMYLKEAFDELMLESKTELGQLLAADLDETAGSSSRTELRQLLADLDKTEQVKPPKTSPEEVKKKSAWTMVKGSIRNRFSGRIGRQKCCSDEHSIEMEPHVHHEIIPMVGITAHYNLLEMVDGRGELFHTNAQNLQRAYYGFRPVHGDGECFYRSFIFSYLEQVLDRQDTHEERRLLAVVKGLARQHALLALTSEFSRSNKDMHRCFIVLAFWHAITIIHPVDIYSNLNFLIM